MKSLSQQDKKNIALGLELLVIIAVVWFWLWFAVWLESGV